MSNERDQHDKHDDALDTILAALRDAAPPQGMEARIAQRLQQHAAVPSAAPFRWRDIFASSAPTGEWWRGAFTGAAAVLLLAGAYLLAGHLPGAHSDRAPMARNTAAGRNIAPAARPVSASPNSTPANDTYAQPCVHPTVLRAASIIPTYATETLQAETRLESEAPSHPAPVLPLTAQERALVRLAQTSTPKQLAVINPAEYANLEAQSALKFERYFAPPAPLPATDGNAVAAPIVGSDVNPEGEPKRDPAIDPGVDPGLKPETY